MAFHVGQKVVCVDAEWAFYGDSCLNDRDPIKGAVYTVAEVRHFEDGAYLGLHELGDEVLFEHGGFRPVIERKTDISIFTRMLTPNDELVS